MFPWLYVLILLWSGLHFAATLITVLVFVILMQRVLDLNGDL
ncbi:E8 early protein [Bos taurus papillomavirus 41]|nr:E8 early protein [Bos taurus papillomavirus 41]